MRRSAPIVVALIAVAVAVAVGVGTVWPAPAAAGADTGGEPEGSLASATAEQIQILGVGETAGEVVIDLAVPPSIGRLAPTTRNFEVADDGQLVDLTVAPVGTAADIMLAIDTSGSMRGSAIAAAKAAAASFLDVVADDARVGLVSFGDDVITHRQPTLDRSGVLADLDALEATGRETVLWDALLVAADAIEGSADARSSIVVLSDGDDTASVAAPGDLATRLGGGRVALYAVAIESQDTDLVALEAAVDDIGGQFLATTDVGQLNAVYTAIAGRLANRYQLRFSPVGEGERTVVIAVASGDGVATARTVIGRDPAAPAAAVQTPASTGGPPLVLNVGDEPVLGLVTTGAPGLLASPLAGAFGLASVFAALTLAGILVARPRTPVRINAAANVDRVGGVNVRLGRVADRLISRHDRSGRIDRRLEAADINTRPGEFLLIWLLVTGAVAVLAGATFGIAAAGVVLVLGAVAANAGLRVRAGRRRARFADQLTETLGIMASSLRAGQSVPSSIELVASEAPSPTAEQFHRIAFEIRVGRDLTESIQDAAARMQSPDLEWLAQAVDINRALGGDLTEILDNVAATIRERRTVARQVDALSAEGRATGWVLLVMPILLFLFSWWRTPEQIDGLLTEPLGQLLLGLAVTGMVVGHLWIRRLVRVST